MSMIQVSRDFWDQCISSFEDASIYQTSAYGAVRRGTHNVNQFVIRRGEAVVGGCQVTLKSLSRSLGIAYIVWGPLWKRRDIAQDSSVLEELLNGVKSEFGIRRGFLLRVTPNAFGADSVTVDATLTRCGFKQCTSADKYRTFRIDLSPSLSVLRGNFEQKWRNHLNKAERSKLTILDGTGGDLYDIFLKLSEEMLERKKFRPGVSYEAFKSVHEQLPEQLKMRVFVAKTEAGLPAAAVVCAAVGSTGIYILGATGQAAKGTDAAYLLHWRTITWLKEVGCRSYDLGGIDQISNPGVFAFKSGLAGKHSVADESLGEFYGAFSLRARFIKLSLDCFHSVKTFRARKR